MKRHIRILMFGIMVPLALAAMGFIGAVYFYRDTSLLTVQYMHPASGVVPVGTELVKGKVFRGSFVSRDRYLGAIGLYVDSHNRINNNILVFRMREKSVGTWYCENKYFTFTFPEKELFPFGCPSVADSLGKTYEFEVYSIDGVPGNAIGIGTGWPYFITSYTFPKQYFLQNRWLLVGFVGKKIALMFANPVVYLYVLQFLIPTGIYLMYYWSRRIFDQRILNPVFSYLTIIFMAFMYLTQPAIMKNSVVLYFVVSVTAMLLFLHKSHKLPFLMCVMFLIVAQFCLFMGWDDIANRCAVLCLFLMVSGLILLGRKLVIAQYD
jgi:hypothetical protein